MLLELLSEEIPARMQARAAADLKRLVTEALKQARLDFDSAHAFATPRRLALVVDGLASRQPDLKQERRGPRADAPASAIQGFLGSVGLSLEDCERRETKKGIFLFAAIEKPGQPTAELLAKMIPDIVAALDWPKSMRWADATLRYVRPLHQILCMFDGAPVAGRLALGDGRCLDFTNQARGHRFLNPESFEVADFAEYQVKLRAAYVILDPAERRDIIEKQADRLAGEADL